MKRQELLGWAAFLSVMGLVACSSPRSGPDESGPADGGDLGAVEDASPDGAPVDGDAADQGSSGEFPTGFLFGTAVAGFQVDMGCPTWPDAVCVDARSDWYAFVTDPRTASADGGFVSGEDPAEVGPGHWELYASDFDLAADELHNNALRTSLEWSRIFPTSTVGIEGYDALRAVADPAAVEHYHDVFAAMAARGLRPLVTLHHYTLPLWIHDGVGCHVDLDACSPRGWLDREVTVAEIAKYAGFVAREYGAEVDLWATQNEPFAVLLPGYVLPSAERSNPPAVSMRTAEALEVFRALVEAHARMVDAVRAEDMVDADGDGRPAEAGIVYAMAPVYPMDPDRELDRQAAENVFYLWNTAFMDAVATGRFDADLDGVAERREELAGRLDWVGVNYKVRIRVEGSPQSALPALSPLVTFNPLTVDFADPYPRGIYETALWVAERYELPIYITENNGQALRQGRPEDEVPTVVESLLWLRRAIDEGADVRGYFYWTLMDNYEWNSGMSIPLGLYAVDAADPERRRVARPLVEVYGRIAEAGAIPPDLAERFGEPVRE